MLEGKTILIGKEPGNGRLLIAVKGGGSIKTAIIGEIGCVPGTVSRCKPAEDVGHCKLTIDQNSNMTLTNLKPQNVTYVNGTEIMTKRVSPDSEIALGKDRYSINLNSILEIAKKLVGQGAAQGQQKQIEVSIKPLKKVWGDYNKQLKAIKIRQKNIGIFARVPIVFTMLGGGVSTLMPDIRPYAIVFTFIALVITVIGIYKQVTDKSMDEQEKLTEKFQNTYVCPNPECRHFVGNQPYNILRQNKKCPYCGCKYSEK